MNEQRCGTCRHFREAGFAGSGWCEHPHRRTTSDLMIMVRKQEIPCRDAWSNSLWEPATGTRADAPPVDSAKPVFARPVPPANELEIAAVVQPNLAPAPAPAPAPVPAPPVEDVVLSEARVVSTYEPDWAAPRLATSSSQAYDAGDAIKKAREAYRGRIKPDKSKWIAPPLSPPSIPFTGAPPSEDADEPTVVVQDRRPPVAAVATDTTRQAAEPPVAINDVEPVRSEPPPEFEPAAVDAEPAWSTLPYEDEDEDEDDLEPQSEPTGRSFWRGGIRRRPAANLGRFASLRWTVDHGAAADLRDEDGDREWAEPTAEDGGAWVGEPDVVQVAERENSVASASPTPVADPAPIVLLPVGPELSPELPRVCRTCRDFRPAEGGDRGWCANSWAFTHRRVVAAADATPCESSFGTWWLPVDDVWADGADVSDHGRPTPLLDGWMPHASERVAQRRRS